MKKVVLAWWVLVTLNISAQTVSTTENGKAVPLFNSVKSFWKLKNDKTERPGVGETESEIVKSAELVSMKGLLASLPGGSGRVGFSLMETVITKPIQRSEGILFEMSGTNGLWVSVLVKDRQAETMDGTLTFQWDFEVKEERQSFTALWKDFVPTIRGKQVQGYVLDLFSVQSLSFQVSRSKQKKWYSEVPLPFEIRL